MATPNAPEGGWTHSPEHLRQNLTNSLKALKTNKVDMWYLHGPDRTTPYEVTLKAVNDLYKEGLFDRFAISNYMAWEVAQICEICKANNYIMPSVVCKSRDICPGGAEISWRLSLHTGSYPSLQMSIQ